MLHIAVFFQQSSFWSIFKASECTQLYDPKESGPFTLRTVFKMETTEHPAPKEEAVNIPLLERRRPSLHLRDIVEKYMQSQKSGLNGGMHPALNTNDPRVTLDTTKHKWVDTEIEEVDLYVWPMLHL